MTKWVYSFGDGAAEGDASMRDLLGGKGANLAEMAALGLPVPPGFTIPTSVCAWFYENDQTFPADLKEEVEAALERLAAATGKRFGDPDNPLLVSVRSGARASMPGMMDTVLNLGLNDRTVDALGRLADERFAFDSYRRFIGMFADVVLGLEHELFENELDAERERRGYVQDTDFTADDLKRVVERYKRIVAEHLGKPFPQDPHAQLWEAIAAVFRSWMNERAIVYRDMHDIPASWGTAVTVQSMVFGNMGDTSATGVAFTRNPSTGERALYGEFLVNAQGEDVVAGIRTPQNLTEAARIAGGSDAPSLETVMPDTFREFVAIADRLERHYRDMQDMEFTVERGRLYMLQTRSGKRTAKAALEIAVAMAEEGLVTKDEAVMRVEPASLDQLLHSTLDPAAPKRPIARGLPASPGAATGAIVFSSADAVNARAAKRDTILVRAETSPEDIRGMTAARGILTARGGMTSHAAVVARGWGKPCVSGAGSLRIDARAKTMQIGGRTWKEGQVVTIDGGTGEVFDGDVPKVEAELSGAFATLMGWADGRRRLGVRANAETAADARTARSLGAEGIGLSRTEHMFFGEERIQIMREMILADRAEKRRDALDRLLPFQRADFVQLFSIMRGLPVTIRLLDPPLHEFLPHDEKDDPADSGTQLERVAEAMGLEAREVRARVAELTESNPMLGHRGCRLLITYPEIAAMQTRAILEAAAEAARITGEPVTPEIMVPLVGMRTELERVKATIEQTAASLPTNGVPIAYTVGTMIELPRAALRAREIAEVAEFFSFGTNDLTQTTFGISRDDAATFLGAYRDLGVMEKDPFAHLDPDGVGVLMAIAVEKGRESRPDIKLGLCGEHGGDPASVEFCHRAGLDYVSCSPYRVPIARLAAAQAAIRETVADGSHRLRNS